MAASFSTRHVSVAPTTPIARPSFAKDTFSSSSNAYSTAMNATSLTTAGVPVKFATHVFSILIKDQVYQLLNNPRIKELKSTEEETVRAITFELTEIIKRIVAQHTKDNYKVIIQVMAYPKQDERNIVITNRCLWNHRTDDVLTIETETDFFKFLIIIHGLAG